MAAIGWAKIETSAVKITVSSAEKPVGTVGRTPRFQPPLAWRHLRRRHDEVLFELRFYFTLYKWTLLCTKKIATLELDGPGFGAKFILAMIAFSKRLLVD